MNKTTLRKLKGICCTCLSTDRKLKCLSDLQDIVNNLFCLLSFDSEAYDLLCEREAVNLYICWECEALMYRVTSFRDQACLAQKRLCGIIETKKRSSTGTCLSKLSVCHQSDHYNYQSLDYDGSIKSEDEDSQDPIKSNIDFDETDFEDESLFNDENKNIFEFNDHTHEMTEQLLKPIKERRSSQNIVNEKFKTKNWVQNSSKKRGRPRKIQGALQTIKWEGQKSSKLTREEKLEKKRQAEKNRYRKIKNDMILYAQYRERNKEKYQKRKQEKKVLSIREMTPKQQRIQRKKWRVTFKKYYDRKKAEKNRILALMYSNIPPVCDQNVN